MVGRSYRLKWTFLSSYLITVKVLHADDEIEWNTIPSEYKRFKQKNSVWEILILNVGARKREQAGLNK